MGFFAVRLEKLADIGFIVLLGLAHEWRDQGQPDARVNGALNLLVELKRLQLHNDLCHSALQIQASHQGLVVRLSKLFFAEFD